MKAFNFSLKIIFFLKLIRNLAGSVHGNFLTVAFSFALGGMIAIHTIGHISGGHVNPAVSFSLAISGRMSWVAFPVYVAGQMIGGFLGAAIVYVVYLGNSTQKLKNIIIILGGILK